MRYVLVQWPESQLLMEHPRFHECLFVQDIDEHDEVGSSAYMCPEDLYNAIWGKGIVMREEFMDWLKERLEEAKSNNNKARDRLYLGMRLAYIHVLDKIRQLAIKPQIYNEQKGS